MSVKLLLAISQFEPQMPVLEINFQFLHTSPRGKIRFRFCGKTVREFCCLFVGYTYNVEIIFMFQFVQYLAQCQLVHSLGSKTL